MKPSLRPVSEPMPDKEWDETWDFLDVRDPCARECAAAVAKIVPARLWQPDLSRFGRLRSRERVVSIPDPRTDLRTFPLQRGFSRVGFESLLGEQARMARRMATGTQAAPLILTAPHYAGVAERTDRPIVYYALDRYRHYGEDAKAIDALETRMCARAKLAVVNSERIRESLIEHAGAAGLRIVVVPNATRAENILPAPCHEPAPLPAEIGVLRRPIAGVIGNLSKNTDWLFLKGIADRCPWLSWVFVGPYDEAAETSRDQQEARVALRTNADARFVGRMPYGRLAEFARALDVAIIPYRLREPTFSGSSTRFYEHLAACRPILGTRCFHELLEKEPLLKLVGDADEAASTLHALREAAFRDGHEEARWRQSLLETWECRAKTFIHEVRRKTAYAH